MSSDCLASSSQTPRPCSKSSHASFSNRSIPIIFRQISTDVFLGKDADALLLKKKRLTAAASEVDRLLKTTLDKASLAMQRWTLLQPGILIAMGLHGYLLEIRDYIYIYNNGMYWDIPILNRSKNRKIVHKNDRSR